MMKNRRQNKRPTKVFAGRYAYKNPLGRGAGGSMYLAEDLHHDRREVALKVLTPEAYQTVQGKMLRREFEILSKLDHPHLVRVYDYGSLPDGGVYLAEEYIDGFSLQDARALLEPRALVDLTLQILQGLSYLHGMGTIHRDIKPANVMVLWLDDASAKPMAKLVDFGLSSMDPTRDTLRGGTRSYMAPEIIRGDKGEQKSDLYSLGVTLYYVLCGVLPFGPRTREDPPPTDEDYRPPEPHRLNDEVPLVLSRFTMALLRQIPDVDYDDAGEALQALAADSGAFDEHSAGRMANALDVAAAPFIRGYFERGILERRSEEDDLIVEWITNADPRRGGSLFLITGDVGCGKSRLIADVESSAKLEGHLTVRLACRERMKPFELLHRLLRQTLELGRSHQLKGLDDFIVPVYVREYLTAMDFVTAGEHADSMQDQAWMRGAFENAAALLAPMRLVLFVDDLELGDEESLSLLREWYDPEICSDRPFLVAAAGRRFRALNFLENLPIEGVTRSDVDFFFRERLQLTALSDTWLDEVTSYAGGKPDAVEELCRSLIDGGLLTRRSARVWGLDEDGLAMFSVPSSMKESFRRRMTSVGAGGRECLELLALVARPVLWESARELLVVGGGSPEKADRMLQTLQWRHMIVMDIQANGRFVRLIHSDLAEVVEEMMSREWRRALHRRIGRHLLDTWQYRDGEALEAAKHLCEGGLEEEAGSLFEVAADELMDQGRFAQAMGTYERALDVVSLGPARALLHLKLARAARALFDARGCRRHLTEAGEIAERTALDWLMYQIFTQGASLALTLGDVPWAREWMERLHEFFPGRLQKLRVQILQARLLICAGELEAAIGVLEACLHQKEYRGSHRERIEGQCHLAGLYICTTGDDAGMDLYGESLAAADSWDDERSLGGLRFSMGRDLRRLGQASDGLVHLQQALEPLMQAGESDLWSRTLLEIARCHADLGEFAEARSRAREALRFARTLGHGLLEDIISLFIEGLTLRGRGDCTLALRSMEPVVASLGERPDFVLDRAEALIELGELLVRAGEETSGEIIRSGGRQLAKTSGAVILLPKMTV